MVILCNIENPIDNKKSDTNDSKSDDNNTHLQTYNYICIDIYNYLGYDHVCIYKYGLKRYLSVYDMNINKNGSTDFMINYL